MLAMHTVPTGWGLVWQALKCAQLGSDYCFDPGLIISRGERHVLFSLCERGSEQLVA